MIVSHKHKFIFIRPTKVAGTSVEVNLAKQCEENDIITSVRKFDKNSDESKFVHMARNNEGYNGHMLPDKIREKIGEKIWNEYYKFTIVRNPYDLAISRYFWYKTRPTKTLTSQMTKTRLKQHMFQPSSYVRLIKNILKLNKGNFAELAKHFDKQWKNTGYYFDSDGRPICDFYIHYEHLDEDYKEVCKHLGMPYQRLPQIKVKQRKEKKHYSKYYDRKARKRIEKIFKKELSFFNYKFEEGGSIIK